jgi:amino acid permease
MDPLKLPLIPFKADASGNEARQKHVAKLLLSPPIVANGKTWTGASPHGSTALAKRERTSREYLMRSYCMQVWGYVPDLEPLFSGPRRRPSKGGESSMKRSASQPLLMTTGFGELGPRGVEPRDPEEDGIFLAAGSLKASVFALITATLGAGSLSLPYAFGSAGIMAGLVLLTVIGIASHYTIHFLVCSLSVRELSSYEELAVACGGRTLGIISECSIILFCFGTAVGYLITLSRILSTVVRTSLGFHDVNRVFELLVVSTFVLLPLCLTEKVGELRWSCIVGVASVGLVTLIVVYHYFAGLVALGSAERHYKTPEWPVFSDVWWPESVAGVVRGFSLITFAYGCQPNVPSIYCELQKQSFRRMERVSIVAISICTIVYVGNGMFGVLMWGKNIDSNILDNYAPWLAASPGIAFVFLGMAIAICVAYPMTVFPVRFSLEVLWTRARKQTELDPTVSRLCGALVVWLSVLCAIYVPSIGTVFELVGSTCGSLTCFCFPCAFYLMTVPGPLCSTSDKVIAVLVFILGILGGVLGTVVSVADIFGYKLR